MSERAPARKLADLQSDPGLVLVHSDAPICPYCGARSILVNGTLLYAHRPDLAHKQFWTCPPCKAWVGCHPGTIQSLGRLADAELRAAKSAVHAEFDLLWKAKMNSGGTSAKAARGKAYAWLASQLQIDPADCHVGHFDVSTCERAVALCKPHADRIRAIVAGLA